MDHTAAVLHNSGLDIGTIFTTVYHMNRLSASIGIQDALIVHIELSIILFIKFFALTWWLYVLRKQAEHFFI